MSREAEAFYPLRQRQTDIGVALAVLIALAFGWLLRAQVEGRVTQFQDPDSPFRMAYPAAWAEGESLQDVVLKVEDPLTDSLFKTSLTVERRELDPASPPPLQEIVDRRIEQRSALTAYHLLGSSPATVGGAPGMQIEYGYVVQPIETPRRAALPVVVRAREYIVVAAGRTYYLTLAAPERAFADVGATFDTMIQSVHIP